ncbi:MAG TPA: FAD-dependent monooxygenase, partial [Actinomycetota bacterium]
MRILTLGGGPAGLYASLLLKRLDPSHDIRIVERNPHDATYGWGVVFSDRTLTEFREADYPTYRRITDDFILWDAIDIHYRGGVIRAGGQGFSGISRKKLLLILQERCGQLGIPMTFEHEFEDWGVLGDFDLVLAADGANSFTRKRFESAFRPSISQGRARFIWFGTTRPFDSFTFIFREHEHGLFQVHAYPFEGATSTFIVECHEDVWRRAGLDAATTEETMAFCEDLFAAELRGHRLLSNKSEWISFPTIKTASWRHENVVLLGDSAHTAHFSIGSGTKLAMEDSIALAEAFERHPEDLDAALDDYEMERRPAVERFQLAAAQSQAYFEDLRRYLHMERMQFAFHLLTRSGRIDYDQLRLRDASFSDEVDRWFERDTAGQGVARFAAPPPMFVPLEVRGVRLENRGVLSPAPRYSAKEGEPTPEHREALLDAARREPGLVVTEIMAVEAEGRITPGDLGLYLDGHADALRDLVEAIHASSRAKVGVRIGHAGRRGSTRPRHRGLDLPLGASGWPLLSASPLPYTSVSPAPREM